MEKYIHLGLKIIDREEKILSLSFEGAFEDKNPADFGINVVDLSNKLRNKTVLYALNFLGKIGFTFVTQFNNPELGNTTVILQKRIK